MAFKTPPDVIPADINRIRVPDFASAGFANFFRSEPVPQFDEINRYLEPVSFLVGLPFPGKA